MLIPFWQLGYLNARAAATPDIGFIGHPPPGLGLLVGPSSTGFRLSRRTMLSAMWRSLDPTVQKRQFDA